MPRRAILMRVMLAFTMLHFGAADEKDDDEEEEEKDDEEGEEGEEDEDGISSVKWGLTIFLIFTFLVLVTVGFERGQEVMLKASTQQMRPVVKQMFSELTILGFLSITTLILSQSGTLEAISEEVFGGSEEGKERLTELLEKVHYILFLVMVVFIVEVMLLVGLGNKLMKRWGRMNDWAIRLDETERARNAGEEAREQDGLEHAASTLIRPEGNSPRHWAVVAAIADGHNFSEHKNSAACGALGTKSDPMARSSEGEELGFGVHEGLVFWGMRREFLVDRSVLPPHLPAPKPLPENFDYAHYLIESLSEALVEMVDVSWSTWAFLMVLALVWCSFVAAFYDDILIFTKLWIGSDYLLLFGLYRFYKHTIWIQEHIICATSASAARDWKSAWSAAVAIGEHPLTVACDANSESPHHASFSSKRGDRSDPGTPSRTLSNPLISADDLEEGDAPANDHGEHLPLWARLPPRVVLTKPRPRLLQLVLGIAPNKQHMLFYFQANGHASHVFLCRLLLLIQALYISVLCVILLPATANFKHCYEHCGHEEKVEETIELVSHTLAAALPLFGFLVLARKAIPQAIHVSSVGTFRSTRLVNMVVREQKADRAVQILETLHAMRRQILAAKKIKEMGPGSVSHRRRSVVEQEQRIQEQTALLESLPKEQAESFSRTFDLYDYDNSGTLDQDELTALLASLGQAGAVEGGSAAFLLGLDTNQDGSVDKKEFMAWQAKAQKGTHEEDINEIARDIFEMFDEDGSGSITINEFQEGLVRFHIEMTPDEMTILVGELDQDHSGDVGLDEFVELLKMHTHV